MAKKAHNHFDEEEIRKYAVEFATSFANAHPNHVNNGTELINVAMQIRDFLANEQGEEVAGE